MHVEAELTDRALLPDVVGRLLDRHDERLGARREAWRHQMTTARHFAAGRERVAAAVERGSEHTSGLDIDGLEL
jgi:sarcosine oxidase delta subunit